MFKCRRNSESADVRVKGVCNVINAGNAMDVEPEQQDIDDDSSVPYKIPLENVRNISEEERARIQWKSDEIERLGINCGWDISTTFEEDLAMMYIRRNKSVPSWLEEKLLRMKELHEQKGKEYKETTTLSFDDYATCIEELLEDDEMEKDADN